ncbi:DUF4349 domain-containing protein [Nesterenkonia muleiensis]|uniref:DUF4349 domain-containing protein n=1 Tax=Nesterenkonia muleiensis TaxID=2282648 RepID=UPI000E771C08|nr:DUF4349 domain-containing protein [Nesterenkonia muleiensis]
MERGLRWFAALLLALFVLTSCGTDGETADTGDDSEAIGAESDQVEEAEPEAIDAEQAQDDEAGSGLAGDSAEAPDRQVITTAYAAVEVDDTSEAVADLLSRTTGYGGYVEDRQEATDSQGNPTRASLTLRLPAENLPDMLDGLEDLGDVSELSESAQDVTGTVRDLDARIEALETSVDRLIEIMAEADTAEDLLQIETTLSQRQADLEALQAERNALGDQVSMSTLQVELSTEPITEVEADGFLGGLQTGWSGLVSTANVLLVAAGAILPWLAVLVVPAGAVVLLIRGRRRRRPKEKASTADSAQSADHSSEIETAGSDAPSADAENYGESWAGESDRS